MLFETTKNGCTIEIILEQFYLTRIGQIIASGVKVVYVYSRQRDILQVSIEALFGRQLSAIRKVIVKLIVIQKFVDIFTTI